MEDQKEMARRLRLEGKLTLREIAEAVGCSRSQVHRFCKGIPNPKLSPKQPLNKRVRKPGPEPEWKKQARQMRAQGLRTGEIASALGRAKSTIRDVVRGNPIPIPSVAGADWDLGRRMYERGEKNADIAMALGVSSRSVEKYLGPSRWQRPKAKPPQPRRVAQTKTVVIAMNEDAESRRRKVAKLLFLDSGRTPAPITLPRLSFMERENACA